MEFRVRLVHAEAGRRVVLVSAHRGERHLGSTLGEGRSAEEAEDRAHARLLQRLQGRSPAERPAEPDDAPPALAAPLRRPSPTVPGLTSGAPEMRSPEAAGTGERELHPPQGPRILRSPPAPPSRPAIGQDRGAIPPVEPMPMPGGAAAPVAAAAVDLGDHQPEDGRPAPVSWDRQADSEEAAPEESAPSAVSGPASDPEEEPPADPEDWSQELTALDLQLRRLGWGRSEEGTYLQRAFGHPSRSRLTRYNDLRACRLALEGLERGSDPAVAAVPLRRADLLAQGDALLGQLGWSTEQGQAFLERELQRRSRRQLSDVQLLQFNMMLEGELLAAGALPAAAPAD